MIEGVESQSMRLGVCRYLQLDKDHSLIEDEYFTTQSGEGLAGFIDWHTRKDHTLYVYAHNLKYDLQLSGLLTILLDKGWKVSLFVVEDPPTFIRLKKGRKSILMVDTFNYWQFSVDKMGQQLGLSKLTMPDDQQPLEDWVRYCKRDVEVLSKYLLEFMGFLTANDLAGLGLTLASQAFRAFRHRFMPCEIIIHKDEDVIALERQAYSGGRVEAYYIGEKSGSDFFKLDVNSMYPFVMKDHLYPVRLIAFSEDVPLSKLGYLLDRYYCIAKVELETEEAVYPLKHNHKLIFPTGRFETSLHHSELVYALEHKHLISIQQLAVYDQDRIFDGYIDFFYGMKLEGEREGNQIIRQQAKILMNSLYGKFGQREMVSKIVDNQGEERYTRLTGYSEALGCAVEVNYLGKQIELRYKGGESAYSFPAIAGAVTAYARMYLWQLITSAGLDHVYYLDTDSLMVDPVGYANLTPYEDPNRLGSLKVEGVSQLIRINGAKDYRFGEDVKHKGLPKSAQQITPNLWIYQQFRGAKSWIKQGLPVGAEVYQRTKERKTPYDKGVILESGKVIPLRL